MSEARKALEGSVREDLGRIVFLSRRAGVPSAHWKPILAATSRAVALLKSVADGGESPGAHSAQVGAKAALAELDTIDRAISGVRAHLYLVFRASPVETLLRVLAQRRSELERMEVRAEVRISGPLRDTAFASPAVLEKTLDGVIANALRAMEACRERKIECTLSAEGRHVRLDIADSGEGIPPDRWERVFDRHFTTKAEGGFGLHYSREALARFGAKIFINESASGTGTVVRIVLLQS
jgi:signal transduction histidine kinase